MSRRNITVLITVHAYGFYSIYVVNGDSLRQAVGTTSVLAAVRTIGGFYMFGRIMPVWSVVLVEFCFAYFMECAYGSQLSFKLACKNFDPKTTHPVLFETAIICATVGLTCEHSCFETRSKCSTGAFCRLTAVAP